MEKEKDHLDYHSSLALLVLTLVLLFNFIISYFLHSMKITSIHETLICLFSGIIVGYFVKTFSEDVSVIMTFSPTIFFNLLLPPIILNSGYSTQKKFLKNAIPILAFAFLGTFASAIMITVLTTITTYLFGLEFTLLENCMFGAILSSTDPITILAIFSQLDLDADLYSIVWGESMLNDSVSIVLFQSLVDLQSKELNINSVLNATFGFLYKFVFSTLIGTIFGLLTALILKFGNFTKLSNSIELSIITLVAFNSYFLSNALHLSGIVSILFCGMVMKRYTYENMSAEVQKTTSMMFQVIAQLSENFIFIYLGVTITTNTGYKFELGLITLVTIYVIFSRYISVYAISNMLNMLNKRFTNLNLAHISSSTKVILFWSGLKGAVSFALAMEGHSKNEKLLNGTVLMVVVATVIGFGASASSVVSKLVVNPQITTFLEDSNSNVNIAMNSNSPEIAEQLSPEIVDNFWFENIDQNYIKPLFVKKDEIDRLD